MHYALNKLFPGEQALEVAKEVEGLDRGEVVEVHVEQTVADLREQGVVELEKAHLICLLPGTELLETAFGNGVFHPFR